MQHEAEIYRVIARYMSIKYPKVIFRFDFAAGMYMSVFQSKNHKAMNPIRGYPDLFIAKPNKDFAGLFIEIKTEKGNPFKKDGQMKANEHTERQAEILEMLNEAGYLAVFGTGTDQCIKLIDEYLNN